MRTGMSARLGRFLRMAAVVSCVVGLVPLSASFAASTGRLIVELEPRPANEGQTVWLYLSERGIRGELFAKAEIRGVTRFEGDVLAGRYQFIIVATPIRPARVGLVGNPFCGSVTDVAAGGVTRVRLDCGIPLEFRNLGVAKVKLSPAANLIRAKREIEETQDWCAKEAEPFFEVYERIKAAPPRKPLVVFPETSLTKNELNLRELEFDADQVRRFVDFLVYRCWEDQTRIETAELNSRETELAEILNETVESERPRLRRLNRIADILDAVARRQKR